jgi:PAS domain-containing protein
MICCEVCSRAAVTAIKILDLDGRVQFMSEGGKRVMEVDDFSAIKGCPWPEFWAGEGNAQAIAAVEAAKAGKTARFHGAPNTAKGTPR